MTRPPPRVRSLAVAAVVAALALAGCTRGVGGSTQAVRAPAGALPGSSTAAAAEGVAADVARLASPDFVLRSHAAERLVAAGAGALPALGAAGEMLVPAAGGTQDSATAPVVAAILSQVADAEVEALLADPHPTLRRAAALEAGQRAAWAPVPALIESLADGDPRVREAAHAALRRLTGEAADPAGGGSRRDRWRAWWSQVGRLRAEGRSAATSG